MAERGERIEATDDDGRRHGVRIGRWRGDDAAATRRRRRGDDGAGTTARRRRGHGDDCGQVLAITTSASMTRARQHGDDGAATTGTRRTRQCGTHSDPHSDPPSILTPILTLPSEEPPRQSSTTFRSSLPDPHSDRRLGLDLWKSRLNRNRTATLLAASAAEVAGLGPATAWHAWSPHREASTNAVNGRVNKVVDLGWKTGR